MSLLLNVAAFVFLALGSSMAVLGHTFKMVSGHRRLTRLGIAAVVFVLIGILSGSVEKVLSSEQAETARIQLSNANSKIDDLIKKNEHISQKTILVQELLSESNDQVAKLKSRIDELGEENKALLKTVEEYEEHKWHEVKAHIRWSLTHPEAYRRLVGALKTGDSLFAAIHKAQESHKKPEVRRQLDAYGKEYTERYAREFAKKKEIPLR